MDKRKERILKAIIQEYIFAAEPVSSKTIMDRYGLNVSSATIRNEMAALEADGYIRQPHVSSGRIPAPIGYRYYVDYLMDPAEPLMVSPMGNLPSMQQGLNGYLKDLAVMLAGLSNYTVIVTEEKYGEERIRQVKLVGLMANRALLVVMLSSSKVKDHVISLLEKVSEKDLEQLSILLNEELVDKGASNITKELRRKLVALFKDSPLMVEEILTMIEQTLEAENRVDVVIEGVRNIFKLPEFNEVRKVQRFIEVMDDQKQVADLLDNILNAEGSTIQVRIGEELGIEDLNEFTVVATNCTLCEGVKGKIGIIGPTRMFYEKNISLLESMMRFDDIEEGNDGRTRNKKDQSQEDRQES